jgi:hypothetical protein
LARATPTLLPLALIDQAGLQPVMHTRLRHLIQTVVQILAWLCLLAMCSVILHKGFSDVSALAREQSDEGFWLALARYVFRNMAGG